MILKPGQQSPQFRLPLLGRGNGDPPSNGPRFESLDQLLTKGPVAMFFVKRGCPTCHFSIPLLDRLHRSYPDSVVSTLLVAQEDETSAAMMVDEFDLQIPVLLDSDPHRAGEDFGLKFVPAGFLIDPAGFVERAFESFERNELEAINARVAEYNSVPKVPLFEAGDGIPAFRPG